MPRFIVEALYDDGESTTFGREFSLDDAQFSTEMLDTADVLFLARDVLASIKTITAAEDVGDTVQTGDVVWRDWYDCDATSVEGRKASIALVLGTKALWQDRGEGFEGLAEMLCPEPWEVREYGLTVEEGYVTPK